MQKASVSLMTVLVLALSLYLLETDMATATHLPGGRGHPIAGGYGEMQPSNPSIQAFVEAKAAEVKEAICKLEKKTCVGQPPKPIIYGFIEQILPKVRKAIIRVQCHNKIFDVKVTKRSDGSSSINGVRYIAWAPQLSYFEDNMRAMEDDVIDS